VTARTPLVYADACVFLEVVQKTHGLWRESFRVLQAAESGEIRLAASRLLAAEIGRFRRDVGRDSLDKLILRYLDNVGVQWAEVDLLIARDARQLSWRYEIKSGADAVHLATAVRLRANYFMSRDGGFPYGEVIDDTTLVTHPTAVWTPSLDDAAVDLEPDTPTEVVPAADNRSVP
jgi:predicted nucleic acid-binding protein